MSLFHEELVCWCDSASGFEWSLQAHENELRAMGTPERREIFMLSEAPSPSPCDWHENYGGVIASDPTIMRWKIATMEDYES